MNKFLHRAAVYAIGAGLVTTVSLETGKMLDAGSSRSFSSAACLALPSPKANPSPDKKPATATSQSPSDLSGYWVSESGGVTKFEQKGAAIVGRTARLSDSGARRGFKVGEECIHGTVSGNKLSGELLGHYAPKYQAKCPEKWVHWNKLNLTLSSNGKVLSGEYLNTKLLDNCKEENEGWQQYRLARIQKPADAGL
jgi:hypothetical protein